MGLLKGLIVILAIKMLSFEVDIWHVKTILFVDSTHMPKLPEKLDENQRMMLFNDIRCNESGSRKIVFPYVETYRIKYDTHEKFLHPWNYYQIKTRFNFKEEWTCCKGYIASGDKCVPHCPRNCEKGTCKKPFVCTCNQGYRMSDDDDPKCVPECSNGCVNGTCVDPEVCTCNEGYWLDSDGFTCRPVCDAECERNHGHCIEPNVCACRLGYRRADNDTAPFACEPVCSQGCTNGRCAAPNVCMCNDGYEMDKFDSSVCRPKCDQPCVFGACTAPGTCTCDRGYKTANASVCEPICSEPCKMGTCVAPESCSCNDGYGHRDDDSKYVCDPICEMGCGNGTCIEPGVCTCSKGYVYDKTSQICKPHCQRPCRQNAECVSPNRCICHKGYRLRDQLPIMTRHMIWSMSHIYMPFYSCQAVCDFPCINGRCTAPNECTCKPGYYPSWIEFHHPLSNHATRVCEKIVGGFCDDYSCGENGRCHESGVCICNKGYARDTIGVCVPFCAQACSNGTCTAPDRCECHDGFASRNESFCEPVCERGCQNGDCIGPNRCICHDEFVPNVGRYPGPECIPECTRNCSGHGECIFEHDDDFRCECYFGWTGEDCDQPNMCVITMAYDHNDVNRITIRNDTNITIIQAHESVPYCECDYSPDNETLCYTVQSDEGNTTFVGCLLSTGLPCYATPHYNASTNVTKIVWPFVTIATLLAAGLSVAAYLAYRKHQKKKLAIGPLTNIFVREAFSTEFLLPDDQN